MIAMGWTRRELEEHSQFEREMHLTVLEYRAREREKALMSMEHRVQSRS